MNEHGIFNANDCGVMIERDLFSGDDCGVTLKDYNEGYIDSDLPNPYYVAPMCGCGRDAEEGDCANCDDEDEGEVTEVENAEYLLDYEVKNDRLAIVRYIEVYGARRTGTGRRIVQEMEEHLSSVGVRHVRLVAVVGAEKFWAALGYTDYESNEDLAHWMHKNITMKKEEKKSATDLTFASGGV